MSEENRLGLSNIRYSSDGINWEPLGTAQEIILEDKELNKELLNAFKLMTTPTEISMKLCASKYNGALAKCLYYMKSKKKRVRRKWAKRMYQLLGGN